MAADKKTKREGNVLRNKIGARLKKGNNFAFFISLSQL